MRSVLFCWNPYAFGILGPLDEALQNRGHETLWYMPARLVPRFNLGGNPRFTTDMGELVRFSPEAVFVPGNEVPHYLSGVKVQVFHGLAGEKKRHFRIRHYFDLYLTQGPFFTRRFEELAKRYGDFEVKETGWCKLDPLFKNPQPEKQLDLPGGKDRPVILYAPTFSRKLTSAPRLIGALETLAQTGRYQVLIKFHDLMNRSMVNAYRDLASRTEGIEFCPDHDILRYLQKADVLVSDTSSVIRECLLLDKPVVSFRSRSPDICWQDVRQPEALESAIEESLKNDPFRNDRGRVIQSHHPYRDGRSSERMIDAVRDYMDRHGAPGRRKLSPYRRYLMNKMFGKRPTETT